MNIHIDIDEHNRAAVVKVLNVLLADEFALYIKTRNFHWNVEAPNFRDLHKMFEEQYEALDETVDAVAERIRSLGAQVPASLTTFAEHTRLKAAATGLSASDMLAELLGDHETLARTLRVDIEVAEEAKDAGTADFLTALLEGHEKTAWMLRSTR